VLRVYIIVSHFASCCELPSGLWCCWLGIRNCIQPVKKLSKEVLVWLSVWSEVQMICIWFSWWHCHPIISCFIKIPIGLTILVSAYPGCHGKEAVKRVPVCLSVCLSVNCGNVSVSVCMSVCGLRTQTRCFLTVTETQWKRGLHHFTVSVRYKLHAVSHCYHIPSEAEVRTNVAELSCSNYDFDLRSLVGEQSFTTAPSEAFYVSFTCSH